MNLKERDYTDIQRLILSPQNSFHACRVEGVFHNVRHDLDYNSPCWHAICR